MIIAIDGPSGSGKSTIAKSLAQRLSFLYIDTGAMYRAVTYFALQRRVDIDSEDAMGQLLSRCQLRFDEDNGLYLNGTKLVDELRSAEVSKHVSQVSAYRNVREALVALQREISASASVVMDGRDIGTVVFPNADLKIFLTASLDERTKRRKKQLLEQGENVDFDTLRASLQRRDELDSSRKLSPLKVAEDALVIDNSDMEKEEVLDRLMEEVSKVQKEKISCGYTI